MNIKTNRALLIEAINSGCQTVAQLAHFLRVRTMIERGYRTF
jgi:hypothetical protein